MATKICPYCRERIDPLALVCRFCKRDLPESEQGESPSFVRSHALLPLLAFTAAMVVGGAVVLAEFLKERRNWLD